jgi:hypothetical protein
MFRIRMGKTRYQKITDLMLEMKMKYIMPINVDTLIKEIKKNIGSDKNRTIKPIIKDIQDFQLIEEKEDGIYIK